MIANLITAIGIATSIGMTQPHQPPLRSGVVSPSYDYEYKTNEVNNEDDIIVGNIYKYTYNSNAQEQLLNAADNGINCIKITNLQLEYQISENNYLRTYKNWKWLIVDTYELDFLEINATQNELSINGDDSDDTNVLEMITNQGLRYTTDYYEYTIYFICLHNETNLFNYEVIEPSDYLGNVVGIEVETEGLYNSIENFIETYLYGNDKLRETEYTIMGTTYNMAEWLAHTTTIVLISLIIIVLVMFIKWLFKQIGNTFNLVGVLQ